MQESRSSPHARPPEARALGGMRAFRREDASGQMERRRRLLGLAHFAAEGEATDPQLMRRLARALRAERRAAHRGDGYDPLRHLLLARLLRRGGGRTAGKHRHGKNRI
jgi:hypothetical protein